MKAWRGRWELVELPRLLLWIGFAFIALFGVLAIDRGEEVAELKGRLKAICAEAPRVPAVAGLACPVR